MGETLGGYSRGLSVRDRAIAALETFLADPDGWLIPTVATPAFPHLAHYGILDHLRATVAVDGRPVALVASLVPFVSPFNLTGSPALAFPAGWSEAGLPIGLQLVGRRWYDMRLLAAARPVVEAAGARLKPDAGKTAWGT